jgi:hypothetical protein
MTDIVKAKFEIPEMRKLLESTGDMPLVEGNMWGDKYWGVCLKKGVGQNNLGIILMNERGRPTRIAI